MRFLAVKKLITCCLIFSFSVIALPVLQAQEFSVARIWNEMVLNAIRNDFARPTVHARNLFHTSIAMYDAFAAYDDVNETYFLGKTVDGFTCAFDGVPPPSNLQEARETAISYAVYRMIEYRFQDAPRKDDIFFTTDLIFSAFGYDKDFVDTDYSTGNPAALGNYIAQSIIEFGWQDGSNELNEYESSFYEPVNLPMNPFIPFFDPRINFGNPLLNDPNRWQPLDIPGFVDQGGNVVEGGSLPFLGPEWGAVSPFALAETDLTLLEREGKTFEVYHDPGPPYQIDTLNWGGDTDDYLYGFSMVSHWRSHTVLDTLTVWDISPNSIGNLVEIPETREEIRNYYDFLEGGDRSTGHTVNPKTGRPYDTQFVPRSDYVRVVAEYWADGLDSETPPGHWFVILNKVNDQPQLVKKYKGEGEILSDLEWDVKVYLTLGGAMHDSAISAWSNKGYYDYIRPISAIRNMVYQGQSSDPTAPNYHPGGVPLVSGSVEQILYDDPLLFPDSSNYGKVKYFSDVFEGNRFYANADYWLPYQDLNFITPPFAGYVSGHSTFSRAAAEVLERFTGDPYFPGGLGEETFEANSFLEFGIPGPSKTMSLQWATYVDAANQSGLSRIWGGIHPPIDDIPGRVIGQKVGISAFDKADSLFGQPVSSTETIIEETNKLSFYPNPVNHKGTLNLDFSQVNEIHSIEILNNQGQIINALTEIEKSDFSTIDLSPLNLAPGIYHLKLNQKVVSNKLIVLK